MRQSIRLARIAGIDVGAHWSVLVIAALLGYGLYDGVLPSGAPGESAGAYATAAIAVAVLFLVCLLAHELAHALVARRYGVGVRRITLWLLGGVSELEQEAPTPRAELLIAGAGPATSLALGAVAAAAAVAADGLNGGRLLIVSLVWLAGVNLILGVFNLLPGAPLDGGRVVRAILWRLRGDKAAAQIAADRVGVGLGFLIGLAGTIEILFAQNLSGLWLVLLAWFLITTANAESADVRLRAALEGYAVHDIMATEPVRGYDSQTVDAFVSNVAMTSRHRIFPVVDFDGRLTGVVHLAQIAHVLPAARGTVRLRDIATPAQSLPVVGPDDPAVEAARTISPVRPLGLVVDGGRLVGVFSTGDLARAVELATFRTGAVTAPPSNGGSGFAGVG